jgi:hypothetical protein
MIRVVSDYQGYTAMEVYRGTKRIGAILIAEGMRTYREYQIEDFNKLWRSLAYSPPSAAQKWLKSGIPMTDKARRYLEMIAIMKDEEIVLGFKDGQDAAALAACPEGCTIECMDNDRKEVKEFMAKQKEAAEKAAPTKGAKTYKALIVAEGTKAHAKSIRTTVYNSLIDNGPQTAEALSKILKSELAAIKSALAFLIKTNKVEVA